MKHLLIGFNHQNTNPSTDWPSLRQNVYHQHLSWDQQWIGWGITYFYVLLRYFHHPEHPLAELLKTGLSAN